MIFLYFGYNLHAIKSIGVIVIVDNARNDMFIHLITAVWDNFS